MHRRAAIGHERDCVYISGLIPAAIADIVYVVRQRQKARLSAIVKKGYLVTVAGERRLFPALFLTTGLTMVLNEKTSRKEGDDGGGSPKWEKKNGKGVTEDGRQVLSRGQRINEPRSARNARSGGERGREKGTARK